MAQGNALALGRERRSGRGRRVDKGRCRTGFRIPGRGGHNRPQMPLAGKRKNREKKEGPGEASPPRLPHAAAHLAAGPLPLRVLVRGKASDEVGLGGGHCGLQSIAVCLDLHAQGLGEKRRGERGEGDERDREHAPRTQDRPWGCALPPIPSPGPHLIHGELGHSGLEPARRVPHAKLVDVHLGGQGDGLLAPLGSLAQGGARGDRGRGGKCETKGFFGGRLPARKSEQAARCAPRRGVPAASASR